MARPLDKQYHYFVASLPELRLDDYKEPYRVKEFIGELNGLLCPCHRRLVDDVLSFFDNRNLIDVLFKQDFNPLHVRGRFTRKEMEAAVAGSPDESLPDYMYRFLEEYRATGGWAGEDRRACALRLEEYFYERMARHENGFIRAYFRFDRALRNIIAALDRRRTSGAPAGLVGQETDDDLVLYKLRTDAGPDFGLAGDLEFITALIEAYEDGDPTVIERTCDAARWTHIETLNAFRYFEVEVLLGFLLKLMICERWLRLEAHHGQEALEKYLAAADA
ncbi:MAG: DUF2764 family protein [Deltaproteobacteria bacterium]